MRFHERDYNQTDFYPRPPRGGRLVHPVAPRLFSRFLSTPSARRATVRQHQQMQAPRAFLSTPSARRATVQWGATEEYLPNFYPRPPRGGRRPRSPRSRGSWTFLSTPSVRRATEVVLVVILPLVFLSTPSVRRATMFMQNDISASAEFLSTPSVRRATPPFPAHYNRPEISIHALREEGDVFIGRAGIDGSNFYPRPPRGGRLWSACPQF